MTTLQFRHKLAEFVEKSDNAKVAAFDLGVSAQFLSDVLHGRREPSARLADALGYEREIQFKRKK